MGRQLLIVSEVYNSAYNGILRMLKLQYLHKITSEICSLLCFPFRMPCVIIILNSLLKKSIIIINYVNSDAVNNRPCIQ